MTSAAKKKITNLQIAAILAVLTLALLILTAPHIGLTWDEPAYIAASESYSGWYGQLISNPLQALSQKTIDQYWEINHEHPPLDKIWSGLVWSVAHFVFDDLTAHRLGNILLVAALVAMIYLIVAEAYNQRTGLLAVGILVALPRFFFHAHLAALDVPAAVAVFAVVYIFWKTKDRPGWKGTVGLGIAWGLAVATKINAVFVLPTILLWLVLYEKEKQLIIRCVQAGLIAFITFILSWPWLFPELASRLYTYVRWVTVDHWEIGQYYLHRFYMPPPWHFPLVMTIAVVPTTILLLYFAGIFRMTKEKDDHGLGLLFLLNSLAPMVALSIGQSMVYDNERLFMPAFIFIAALAAIGANWVLNWIHRWLGQIWRASLVMPVKAFFVLLVFAPQIAGAVSLYPHLLSYYSTTVGGLPGATRIGLETTYWCETYNETLDYLNENASAGDVIWIDPWSQDVMVYYQLHGRLRDDLQIAVPPWAVSLLDPFAPLVELPYDKADFIVLQYRQTSTAEGGASYPILGWLDGRTPELRFSYWGIPLIDVYRNE